MPGFQLDQDLTDRMVEKAVAYCASKKFAGDAQQTVTALRQGQCEICSYVSGDLVRQVAEVLGEMDRTVKAVYLYKPEDPQNRSRVSGKTARTGGAGINLVTWVDRKSAALSALGATLESTLAESRRKLGCKNASPACFTLDIQMVDDRDIQEGRGYSLVVQHPFLHTVPVWKRQIEQPKSSLQVKDLEKIDLLGVLNPELAPESAILEQALMLERLPSDVRADLEAHLSEFKVVLIRKIISDQLAYIHIAKDWFTVADLQEIYNRRIGNGRVGGKAAGLLLAARILKEMADDAVLSHIHIPESFFIGSDLIYIFMAMNGLMHWNDQKYKPEEKIRAEYPQIQEAFQMGEFPPEILRELRSVLNQIGQRPLIVRSSSQLEDNFGTSFAGKYDSVFCPNQGAPQENLKALTRAIARTYASTLKPEALLYRRSKGLQDYDERMSILIQTVQGAPYDRKYFLPLGAGVAFSRNLYRWAPQIRREDGFMRLVWGLGTRAVERVGNDYPRLVALSHPTLHPDDDARAIRRYSQQFVDVIDLQENEVKTMPFGELIGPGYPALRYLAQIEEEGYLSTVRGLVMRDQTQRLVLTFDELLRRTPFASLMQRILKILEEHYRVPVDLEFTVQIPEPEVFPPQVKISLLQCRPQSHLSTVTPTVLPRDLHPEKIIFSTQFMVPQGYLANIRTVLFVTPDGYFRLQTQALRNELSRVISWLNANLQPKSFICVGPGRWGTTNPDLGVYVNYSDVYNAGALVELSGKGFGLPPEPSLGTHFFQDLMEAQIYPLAINLDEASVVFNRDFFYQSSNQLLKHVEASPEIFDSLRVIQVAEFQPNHHLEVVMDDDKGQAVAFLVPDG